MAHFARLVPVTALGRGALAVSVLAAVAALVLPIVSPAAPEAAPRTDAGRLSAQVQQRSEQTAIVRTQRREPIAGRIGEVVALGMEAQAGDPRVEGLPATRYVATMPGTAAANRPASLSTADVAALNGGRVPAGIQANDGRIPVTYRSLVTATAWLDNRTSRVLDVAWREVVTATAGTPANSVELARPVAASTVALPPATVRRAVDAARKDHRRLDDRAVLRAVAGWSLVVAGVALVLAFAFWLLGRRSRPAVAAPRATARHARVTTRAG